MRMKFKNIRSRLRTYPRPPGRYFNVQPVVSTLLLLISFVPLVWAGTALASSLPAPKSPVALVIKGDMQNTNIEGEAHFDMEMLMALPRTEFTTTTPWDEGPQTFAGVRVSDLLTHIGSPTLDFKAIGVDDYKFDVTGIAFDEFPIIIAYEHNGETISVRKLGPLRLIFPLSDYPELATQINESSAVWQLVEMQLL